MGLTLWNPWHGCIKYSEGCKNCYVYRIDRLAGRQSDIVHRNSDFDMPLKRMRNGDYKMRSGDMVYTCLSSDFFLEDADEIGRVAEAAAVGDLEDAEIGGEEQFAHAAESDLGQVFERCFLRAADEETVKIVGVQENVSRDVLK